jgi:hypothetical protein
MKNPLARKTPTSPDPRKLDKTTPLDARLAELRARRTAATDKIIELEAGGAQGSPNPVAQRALTDRAERLLGAAELLGIAISEAKPASSINELRAEVEAIDLALRIGGTARDQIIAARAAELIAARSAEWRELIHQTVQTLCHLRHLNRARAQFRRDLSGHGSGSDFPCQRHVLFGVGAGQGGEADSFFTEAIRAGIITAGELDRMMENDE